MTRTTRLAISASALALLTLAGCQDDIIPTQPEGPGAASDPALDLRTSESALPRPHEEVFHKVASEVKSFGGFFYDEEGNMVAYLADPSEEDAARKALEPIMRERDLSARERSTGRLVIQKADFSFLELASWRDQATEPVLEQFGVQWSDLDEAQNRLVVGIATSSARESVMKVLEEHRVPVAAVAFEETGKIEDHKTLRDYSRPIEGGYQIQRPDGGTCTLGFNAYRSGYAAFLTNSHCTYTVWGNKSTSIYQNVVSGANKIGTEWIDPTPFSCYLFLKCRWSDAAVIAKTSGVSWNYGRIARTTSWGSPGNTGSITIDEKNPRMTIIGEYSFPVGGEMFDKMGRTTGWTYGFVKKTCVDMVKSSYAGPGVGIILCQDWANYTSNNGDSGSPVFRWYGNTVRLAGIHWGGITKDGTRYALLSAMWNIEKDLGALSTF
jgi:hypothetical protein